MDDHQLARMALEDIAKQLKRIADALAPPAPKPEPHLAAVELL